MGHIFLVFYEYIFNLSINNVAFEENINFVDIW